VTVRDWMSPDPVSVSPDATVAEARELLEAQGFRHLLVISQDRLVGIISDRGVAISGEALRAAVRNHDVASLLDDERPVESVMSGTPHVIGPEAEIGEAARLLVSRHINALPVVDIDGSVIGIITSVDCLLAALEQPADV
jgi:CBS domain-containing protein